MEHVNVEIDQLYEQRVRLQRELNVVKEEISIAQQQSAHGSFPIQLANRKSVLELQLLDVQQKIAVFATANASADSFASINKRLGDDLKAIRRALNDPQPITSLEKQITALTEITNQTIKQLRATSLSSGLQPKLSVIRPNVKLIDANLAYRYADLQNDTNILVGFTTLFLGSAIAAGVSLGISLSTTVESTVTAINAVVTVMSLLVSVAFGFLVWQARKKSEAVRKLLESDAGEQEIDLQYDSAQGETLDRVQE